MPAYVALLRGVNVGRAKRVAMADFRALLVELGFVDVATLLNSGNAVFIGPRAASSRHAAAIAAGLAARLGVEVQVVVKSFQEFAAAVDANPFVAAMTDPSRLLVAFTQDATVLQGLAQVATVVKPPEQFAVGTHAAYLHCVHGILASAAGEALLGKVGRLTTTRNWATTLKVLALLQARSR